MKRFLTTAVLTLGLSSVLSGSCQELLYNQPSGATPSSFAGIGSGGGQTAYDNFVLPSSASVGSVSWDGYFATIYSVVPDEAYLTSFNVSFYADNGSHHPGTLLYSTTIVGTAGEVLSTQSFAPTYEYSVTLPTAFSAVGGAPYWFSVEPSLTPSAPQWAWLDGTGGDGLSTTSSLPLAFYGSDLTFALYTVPEPSSVSLFLLGCIFWIRRQRR